MLKDIDKYKISSVRSVCETMGTTQKELSLQLGKGVGFIEDIEAPSK